VRGFLSSFGKRGRKTEKREKGMPLCNLDALKEEKRNRFGTTVSSLLFVFLLLFNALV
jgi:hypothetical protein